jgi:hypothetical protein
VAKQECDGRAADFESAMHPACSRAQWHEGNEERKAQKRVGKRPEGAQDGEQSSQGGWVLECGWCSERCGLVAWVRPRRTILEWMGGECRGRGNCGHPGGCG